MGVRYVRTVTVTGPDVWLPTNRHGFAQVALQVSPVGAATGAYTVESTLDNVLSNATVPANDVFPHPVLVAQTTAKQDSYAIAPEAIRINFSAISGTWQFIVSQRGLAGV